jgi:hypothetical protein
MIAIAKASTIFNEVNVTHSRLTSQLTKMSFARLAYYLSERRDVRMRSAPRISAIHVSL